MKTIVLFLISLCAWGQIQAQNSIPYQWSQMMLTAIRNDYARPPMTARNLHHLSMAMYDAWAAYDDEAATVFLGKTFNGYPCPYSGIIQPDNRAAAQDAAISYAAYFIIRNRYINAPGWGTVTNPAITFLMGELGYDINFTSVDYTTGDPRALGNYIAARIISYGNADGSNQLLSYANQYYTPLNPSLFPTLAGTNGIVDPNRWQPLSMSVFIDQNGNLLSGAPPFMGAEWGNVKPFAMTDADKEVLPRDGHDWTVYHNPGPFPHLNETGSDINDLYKWNFALVAKWGGHLDQSDNVIMDASPANIGGAVLPNTFADQTTFYDFENGGDNGIGHTLNPVTGQPYTPQWVKRGDYARVLAEFWADGPNSETPPGHWFAILNYVIQQLQGNFVWEGTEPISETEFCLRAYLTMGGAVHDAAISAWGIKGYYDGVRPISAIRHMAEMGQSTDANLPHYHPEGFPLMSGFSELIVAGDPLQGANGENIGKIKLYSWYGPDSISNAASDVAGAGWVLGEKWYPYQRPTFVTPPFAGYVSGHSTYSRAAAEVMTAITGDEYFPGGMGVFEAPMNAYLVFEDGPSDSIQLQWATYRDASDQCSLSRIWGGIHPPMDDIAGRKIGMEVAADAIGFADQFWVDQAPKITLLQSPAYVNDQNAVSGFVIEAHYDRPMDMGVDPDLTHLNSAVWNHIALDDNFWLNDSVYRWVYTVMDLNAVLNDIDVKIMGALSNTGDVQRIFYGNNIFVIDTENPYVLSNELSGDFINESVVLTGFSMSLDFNETVWANAYNVTSNSATLNTATWTSSNAGDSTILLSGTLLDVNEVMTSPNMVIQSITDWAGNAMVMYTADLNLTIDTEAPVVESWNWSATSIDESATGTVFSIQLSFIEAMDTSSMPQLSWTGDIAINASNEGWLDSLNYVWNFVVEDNDVNVSGVTFTATGAWDVFINPMDTSTAPQVLDWNMNPWVEVLGCVDVNACNYDTLANTDNGSCYYEGQICDDGNVLTTGDVWTSNCLCEGVNGISENVLGDKVAFYPNPGHDQLTIVAKGNCRIVDAQGREVFRNKLQGTQVIITAEWDAGMYVIQFGASHLRWIKE
jgi:hypothetical protein